MQKRERGRNPFDLNELGFSRTYFLEQFAEDLFAEVGPDKFGNCPAHEVKPGKPTQPP